MEAVCSLRRPVAGAAVSWHNRWDAEVSAFYADLGGEGWLPEPLMATLLADQSIHTKRVALLSRRGRPWALVPLRWTSKYWEPLLRAVAEPFPDMLVRGSNREVFAALNVGVFVRYGLDDPAGFRNRRWTTSLTAYELDLDESPELYWRHKDRWKSVTQSRKRTAAFELVTGDPAAERWTVEQWRDRWGTGNPMEAVSRWHDRLAFDDWGRTSGVVKSWALRDGSRWVAGCIGLVRGDTMYLQTVARDREYDWHAVGTRTFSEAVLGAWDAGLRRVSLGAGLEYKRWWAKPKGARYSYLVAPRPVQALHWAVDRATALRGRA